MAPSMLWTLALLLAVPVSLLASWRLLVWNDFFYPHWHDVIGIDKTIAEYGPKNRYRHGFELTTPGERARLFSAIVDAIHTDGVHLEGLVYHDAQGNPVDKLLRVPEITHLRDVARLVYWLHGVGLLSALLLFGLLMVLRYLGMPIPPPGRILAIIGGVAALLFVTILTVGARESFYALHELVFPPGHQWFFFYEDSLMTMMMKAPDLFAVIALEWLLLAGMLYGLLLWGMRRLV